MVWRALDYTSKDELAAGLSDLVTVSSLDSDGSIQVVGTAFPIMASESNIVLLSATHVVEEAFSRSRYASHVSTTSDMTHLPYPDNSLYLKIENWITKTSDLKCQITVGQKIFECDVIGSCLRPPLDIALFVVDSTPISGKMVGVFSIDSEPLNVGDEVVVTSFVTEKDGANFSRTIRGRLGKITAIDGASPLVNAPVYETNIPIESGASGGPVFAYQGKFTGPKKVIGVVSSDFSRPESFDNMEIDGHSRVSMICSAAPLQIRTKEDGLLSFKELCEREMIKDHGSAMKSLTLEYYPDGNWHQGVPIGRR